MPRFYAVSCGRRPGVYTNMRQLRQQISDYPGSHYEVFDTRDEAEAALGLLPAQYAEVGLPSTEFSFDSTLNARPANPKVLAAAGGGRPMAKGRIKEIYTDGSCIGNGTSNARAGWGAYWGDSRDACGPVTPATNNAAELRAIYEVLEVIQTLYNPGYYRIYTDSEYALKALTVWGNIWERNGWRTSDGQPVKNLELIMTIRATIKKLMQKFHVPIELVKVKGHARVPGNAAADILARSGAALDPSAGIQRALF